MPIIETIRAKESSPTATPNSPYHELLSSLPEDLQREVATKSIGLILDELFFLSLMLHTDGKRLSIALKKITDAQADQAVREKVATYNRFSTIFTDALRVVSSGLSTYAGGPGTVAGGIFGLFGEACSGTNRQLLEQNQAGVATADHQLQTAMTLGRELGDQTQTRKHDIDATLQTDKQRHDAVNRTFMAIMGIGST